MQTKCWLQFTLHVCCIFHENASVRKKAIFILSGKGLRAERAWQEETWESLLEFADSDVDPASLGCYFFFLLSSLSHPFFNITQTG